MNAEEEILYSDDEQMSICEGSLPKNGTSDVDEERASALNDDEHSSDGSSTSSNAEEEDSNTSR